LIITSASHQKSKSNIVKAHIFSSTITNLNTVKKKTIGDVIIDIALNSNIGKKSLHHFLSAIFIHFFSWR